MKKNNTTAATYQTHVKNRTKGKLDFGLLRTAEHKPVLAAIEKARDIELTRRDIRAEKESKLSALLAEYPLIENTSIISPAAYQDETAYKAALADFNLEKDKINRAAKEALKDCGKAYKYFVVAPLFGTTGLYDAYTAYINGEATADVYETAVKGWIETCLMLPASDKAVAFMVNEIKRATGAVSTGENKRFYDDVSTDAASETGFQKLVIGRLRDILIAKGVLTADTHKRPVKVSAPKDDAPTIEELARLAALIDRNRETAAA